MDKDKIINFLKNNEISILEFSKSLGISRNALNKILSGKTKSIRLSTQGKIERRMQEILKEKL